MESGSEKGLSYLVAGLHMQSLQLAKRPELSTLVDSLLQRLAVLEMEWD